jgi:cytochrome P450
LEHPEQLELLRSDRSLLPSAIEELLRYDTPLQVSLRWPTEDVELGDHLLPAGEPVCALHGSANRDPAEYPDPDRLDFLRPTRQHVAFGMGIHFCLGASLARQEAAIAFDTLLGRLRGLARTAEPLERIAYVGLRGLKALPLTFESDAPAGVR